jgi:hypothetical protein
VIEHKNNRVNLTRMRVESTRVRVVIKQQQQQKTNHVAGACRSKVYVYYEEFKVIS